MIPGLCSAFYPRPGTHTGSFSATTDTPFQEVFGEGTLTTGTITAIPIGGTAPYTYSWTIDGSPTLTHPTSAATEASTTLTPDDFVSAMARCVITDANSLMATTPDVTFSFQWT